MVRPEERADGLRKASQALPSLPPLPPRAVQRPPGASHH